MSASREWWQECTEDAFRERLAAMSENGLAELSADMAAVHSKIEASRQAGGPDENWRRRTRYASLMLSSRRKLLKAEMTARHEANRTANYRRKRRMVEVMRARLDAGDLEGCVRLIVDSFDPDQKGRR